MWFSFKKKKKKDYYFYVVDDVREQTKVIRSILRSKFDADVEIFQSPIKLLKSLKRPHHISPDMIIADLKMPEMTGLELRTELLDLGFSIPFVFITSAGAEEIVASDTIMLSKPIDVSKLAYHIDYLLKRSA